MRALIQRLKRRHARAGQQFHVTRGGDERYFSDLGYWYATENNVVRNSWKSVDGLVAMARYWGALAPHETLAEE